MPAVKLSRFICTAFNQNCPKSIIPKMSTNKISDLKRIFNKSVSSVLPETLIRKNIQYDPKTDTLTIANKDYALKDKNLYVVGTGKAVRNMALEIERILATKITKGIVSIPTGILKGIKIKGKLEYCEGAQNNLPDEKSEETARKIIDLAFNLTENDLLLVLISGGGSALLPLPITPITLQEKCDLIKQLSYKGADIKELNTVRKKISETKGGKLAIKAQPATVVSLILSDIIDDPLDLIASGPTVYNEDHYLKAFDIIKKYDVYENLPHSIKDVLNQKDKSSDFPQDKVKNHIIGSNKISLNSALEDAKQLGYLATVVSNTISGNVLDVAKSFADLALIIAEMWNENLTKLDAASKISKVPFINADILNELIKDLISEKPICLIFGGETTVEVKGNGKGGRNQQLALEFGILLNQMKQKLNNIDIYLLCAGTDGIDGPTDAAGAISYVNILEDAKKEGLDVKTFLDNNDSYNFYSKFNNSKYHVITGHTNTNVMDIDLLILSKKLC